MKVLVTGSSGLLGSSLLPYLKKCGFNAEGLAKTGLADHQCDLADRAATATLLDRVRPDAIVNLVALTSVNECEKNPNKAFRDNVRTLENIASVIGEGGETTRLLHISSDHVYSGQGPHKEDDINPVNTYAITKLRSEEVALSVGGTVLRTNFFGPHLGPDRKGFWEYVTSSLKDGKHFRISEASLFNPVAISTLCRVLGLVLERPQKGVFNIGSRDGFSKGEFVREICRWKGWQEHFMIRDEEQVFFDNTEQMPRPDDMRMDCGLFESSYGLRLPSLREEIKGLIHGGEEK